jgi:hypothetical protein
MNAAYIQFADRAPGQYTNGCIAAAACHVTAMSDSTPKPTETTPAPPAEAPQPKPAPKLPKEIGGVEGPDPTRYGDGQHKGGVTDF